MSNVTVFLRTALFSFGQDDGHVPPGTMVLRGAIEDDSKSGTLTMNVNECLDGRGKLLSDAATRLILPMSKVDHILIDRA